MALYEHIQSKNKVVVMIAVSFYDMRDSSVSTTSEEVLQLLNHSTKWNWAWVKSGNLATSYLPNINSSSSTESSLMLQAVEVAKRIGAHTKF